MVTFHKLRIAPEFEMLPHYALPLATSLHFQDGCSKQLYQVCSYLLLSWRCRAPSPEWPSLRSFEPLGCTDGSPRLISHSWSVASGCAAEGFQFSAWEFSVKGKQSAALLCTSSVFTCLHRCMSSASALMCEFLLHLFTVRVLERLLKWTWVSVEAKMDFIFGFKFFWPSYLFTLTLKCN